MTDTTEHTLRPEHVTPADAADASDSAAATDETGTDQTAEDTEETGGDAGSGPDPRLLEELDEHIRAARAAAEEALGDSEHTFVESGDQRSESQDDQTIAPP